MEEKLGCRLDDSMRQTVHLSLKNFKRNKEKWFTKKRKTLNYDEYDKNQSDRKNEILMQVEVDNSPPDDEMPAVKARKAFNDLNRKQQVRRTQEIWEDVNKKADDEGISVERLLAFLLTRCNAKDHQEAGRKLLDGEKATESHTTDHRINNIL